LKRIIDHIILPRPWQHHLLRFPLLPDLLQAAVEVHHVGFLDFELLGGLVLARAQGGGGVRQRESVALEHYCHFYLIGIEEFISVFFKLNF
jgi:hypothetical protein